MQPNRQLDDATFAPTHSTLVKTASSEGLESSIVTIETRQTRGFAGLQIIGNTAEICRDGKERAKVALEQLGLAIPNNRILINLAPADIKKDGNHFDLPIALSLALMIKEGMTKAGSIINHPTEWVFAAELSLSGQLRPTRGIISYALSAAAAGLKGIIVARANVSEVEVLTKLGGKSFRGFQVLGFDSLGDVLKWVYHGDIEQPTAQNPISEATAVESSLVGTTFDDMHLNADQVLMIKTVGAGMHSVMLSGNPGCGKSMLAERLTCVFPKMSRKFHLESLQIQSLIYRSLPEALLNGRPPFRSPHHQTSPQAILGTPETPGELSLAHGGVLFLDEFPEFRRDIIESLREPLERGCVQVSRARRKMIWASQTLLVAARNNCPCGWADSAKKLCTCPPQKKLAYLARLSGPILDRIDIHFNFAEVNHQSSEIFKALRPQSSSQTQEMRNAILKARQYARLRNRKFGCVFNRDIKAKDLIAASGLSESEFDKMLMRFARSSVSARSVVKGLRVARTLADLADCTVIAEEHFRQAWFWQNETAARARGESTFEY